MPLLATYFDGTRIAPRYAFAAMLLGWLTSLGWLIAGTLAGSPAVYPLGIEPMYPGLGVSIICWSLGKISGGKNLKGGPGKDHP